MADVLIHHCTLRVVRRGGWSWGAEPRRLLDAVVRAFPRLLERRLTGLLPADADAELSAPVRLTLKLRLDEALALAASGGADDGLASDLAPDLAQLEARLEAALKSHPFVSQLVADAPAPADAAASPRRRFTLGEQTSPTVSRRGPLLDLLLRWRGRGELDVRLAGFTLDALEVWHSALLEAAGSRAGSDETVSAATVRRLVRELADEPLPVESARADVLRRRIVVAVEVVEQFGHALRKAELPRALDEVLPLVEVPPDARGEARGERAETAGSPGPTPDARAREALRETRERRVENRTGAHGLRTLLDAEVYVSSALPFLLLPPLSQTGYLATLAAALEAAGLGDASQLFAAALAFKVLPPPEPGWPRKHEAAHAAATFAALAEPAPEEMLTDFSRRSDGHLSPADATLTHTLAFGHNPLKPLLLYRPPWGARRAEGGLMLFDVEGVFLIAWEDDLQSLRPSLRQFGQTLLLVPRATASPELLKTLDAGRFLFVTDAPPSRGESWRRVSRTSAARLYTNDTHAPDRDILRASLELERTGEEAELLWRELGAERVSVPLASEPALERSLTLAAATALGTIAWTLWRTREEATPLLALERFGDFDGRVSFSADTVRLRLPLGRRHRDLYEHGLLADVGDVPWLGGRRLVFSGG